MWNETEAKLQILVNHFQDKVKYNSFSWMISEERKKYCHLVSLSLLQATAN